MSALIALIFHSSLGVLVSKLTHFASFKLSCWLRFDDAIKPQHFITRELKSLDKIRDPVV